MPESQPPTIPPTWSGGVDLTDAPDVTDAPEMAEYLAHLNRQPDTIQTLTGGHGSLMGSVHLEVDPDPVPWEKDKTVATGLAEVKTRWDGHPVALVPASEYRPLRFILGPGQGVQIAQVDPRRSALGIAIYADNGAAALAYVGNTQSNTQSNGFMLATNSSYPCSLIVEASDQLYIKADPANTVNLTLSVAAEYRES